MMGRREFLAAAGTASVLAGGTRAEAVVEKQAETRAGRHFVTISYNVYGCRGWPRTKGNAGRLDKAAPQIPERLALELALYSPDVVTLSEAPNEDVVARLAQHLSMSYAYFSGGFPGALLTRHRIVESANHSFPSKLPADDEPFSRHFGQALLETPAGELAVYSAHLNPRRRDMRLGEIAAILETMRPDLKANRSLILQGDLNHKPDHPEYEKWQEAGLVDAFAARGLGPGGTVTSLKQRARIDYIWLHGPILEGLISCSAQFDGAFRTNPDDPYSFALSDHVPVLAVFRL